ncbi:MAG TPA: helix-turn-helix domain-containing protein [Tepidisphaeraceae bacterium]|jgi:predicted XRE-type DNA-binding protein
MKHKVKPIIVRNIEELANAFNLSPADAVDMEIRNRINDKIIEAVAKSGLTHAQIAKAAGTSRSRLTAIVNRDRSHVSTDLMLRILATLGYRTKITFARSRKAGLQHTDRAISWPW